VTEQRGDEKHNKCCGREACIPDNQATQSAVGTKKNATNAPHHHLMGLPGCDRALVTDTLFSDVPRRQRSRLTYETTARIESNADKRYTKPPPPPPHSNTAIMVTLLSKSHIQVSLPPQREPNCNTQNHWKSAKKHSMKPKLLIYGAATQEQH
jgi:hypothetical protein